MSKKIIYIIITLIVIVIGFLFAFYIVKNNSTINTSDNSIDVMQSQEKNIIATTTNNQEVKEEIDIANLSYYIKEIWDFENSNIGPMPTILVKLNLSTHEEVESIISDSNVNDTTTYIKSNVSYQDFKNALLKYVSEDYFNNNFSDYKNIDGYVAFCNTAAGFPKSEYKSMKLIETIEDKKIYEVTMLDVHEYDVFISNPPVETAKEEDCYFKEKITFLLENNRYVIDDMEYIKRGL